MQYRGLFRLCGSVARTKQLRQRWDSGERVDLEHEQDVPTVASLLKLFLRELPTPLVPEVQRKQLVLSFMGTRKCFFKKSAAKPLLLPDLVACEINIITFFFMIAPIGTVDAIKKQLRTKDLYDL